MGGGYLRRTAMMLAVSPVFTIFVALMWKRFCTSQGLPFVKSSIRLLLEFREFGFASFVPHWLTWFKSSFHPSCTDKAEAKILQDRRAELDAKRVLVTKKGVLDKEMLGPILLGPSHPGSASNQLVKRKDSEQVLDDIFANVGENETA